MTVSSTEVGADGAVEIENTVSDVNTVESSTTESNSGEGSLLDAVNAALKSGQEETPASAEQGSKEPATESTENTDELSEEEKRHFSERAQHRFRELVEQRKNAEGEAAKFQQELEAIKPKAQRMDELTGYMQQHSILPEHLNNALGLTAMINKGDFASALPVLENLISQVRAAAGEVLPADLQKQVELGYLTEAHAKELHKARLGEQRSREQAARLAQQSETERHQREVQQLVEATTRTADTWSREQAQTDPDWNLKRDRVTEKVELELRRLGPEGYPRNDKAVRELLGKVKQEVEAELRRFRPTPKPIDPSPSGHSASPRSTVQPKTLMEFVDRALTEGE